MTTAESTARAADAGERPDWHALSPERTLDELDGRESGLTETAVRERRETHGPNEIRREAGVNPLSIFLAQFQDVLVYLLVAAAALSLAVGLLPGFEPNYTDAALIAAILLANGGFGFVQDYRAERSIEALRELSAPTATVVRDGDRETVPATELVPGDVVVLSEGDAVPADARLLEAHALETDESALTGESASVTKAVAAVDPETPLAERSSLVFMDTAVVRGRARAVVVRTGMDTAVGEIAAQIAGAGEDSTPFQDEVDRLGRQIGSAVVALVVVLATVQVLATAASPLTILLVGVTLAVAAVPEGLPAVVTFTLALGSRRLLARDALVRRLPVVESLGAVDVVVTDKTGTLTENRMTVVTVVAGDDRYEVTGAGTTTQGEFRRDGQPVDPSAAEPVLRCGAVCNDAQRVADDEGFDGDPTEVALLVAAEKAGVVPDLERVRELPFSSERKRMTVVVEGDPPTAYTKGAPETVLERCDRALVDGEVVALTDRRREAVLERTDDLASEALRVLGFASRTVEDPAADAEAVESGLVFLGLQGMIDPPRAEVPAAVEDCRSAGVRVVMVTGDNVETAKAVGREVGLDPAGALTGRDLAGTTDEALAETVEEVSVFARVDPRQKVRILERLQANDHRVAMTGDGVNDAPALRNADVGIAMGIRGTDVAKGASDLVLRDDNFATIRTAIAEGRGVFDNVRKFVNYLLSANAGEVLVVFVGVLLGAVLFPSSFAEREALVLTPVMLLWINLVTDGLPALALGADPKTADVLTRPPRPPDESVIDGRTAASIAAIGAVMTVTGLGVFFSTLAAGESLVRAQTTLFTFLVVVEVVRIQLIRSRYDLPVTSNRWLVAAVAVTLGLQLVVVYTPLAASFSVVALDAAAWARIAVGFLAFVLGGVLGGRLLDRLVADRGFSTPGNDRGD
jgi:Ca2+-transporting ATPase